MNPILIKILIRFKKGLPQDDALFPMLFILCLNPIAWKVWATEGYRLSKPISTKTTNLPNIDDMKLFAASENKLKRVCDSHKDWNGNHRAEVE